jgi:hypothetical protein
LEPGSAVNANIVSSGSATSVTTLEGELKVADDRVMEAQR